MGQPPSATVGPQPLKLFTGGSMAGRAQASVGIVGYALHVGLRGVRGGATVDGHGAVGRGVFGARVGAEYRAVAQAHAWAGVVAGDQQADEQGNAHPGRVARHGRRVKRGPTC